jgi:CubicO group peptidase (beta-lactamase class C family)
MNRRTFLHCSGLAAVALADRATAWADDRKEPKNISDLLATVVKDHKLPGIAAIAVRDGQVIAQGVAGLREIGKPDVIQLEDRFAIGSCTKRMTVLLMMRLVDAGKLKFETTVAESLPDVKTRDEYRKVTLAQLLTFTGGIQPYEQIGPRRTPILFEKGTVAERLPRFVGHVLNEEPINAVGTERYSNASYILAGYMAERLCKAPFSTLMGDYVFKPLDMIRSGFGRPRTADRPNEPWQHTRGNDGYKPIPVMDALPEAIMGAPGGVHCSIGDFAKFAAYMLAAAQGQYTLLKPATVEHAKKVLGREQLGGGGEDFGGTQWLTAGMQVSPRKKLAIVVAVNGGDAEDACHAVFEGIGRRV